MKKEFRVASISSGANSFGLHGHILVSRDGTAFEVARCRSSGNKVWAKHEDVHIPTDEFGDPLWAMASCEIPRRLDNPPEGVLKELFGADFKIAFPKSRQLIERAKAGVKMAVTQEDTVASFVVNQETWAMLCYERPPEFTTNQTAPNIFGSLLNVPLIVEVESKITLAMNVRVQL